ncbi:PepSY-associated TM helix domain-containing protein [Bradyrhizobium sp. HKCCYLS1011]|uniref:PepSY-associated TM helix domain-containing protein n=1 Tax=Bradyrhizobium sp. HKCCYLS1011 TaxID=3420733 RepID=UPI003EBB1EF8
MTAGTIRVIRLVHQWSSLISTVFLLLLCLTGLPLIFHHEIDEWLGYAPQAMPVLERGGKATVNEIARAALAHAPGKVLQYLAWDRDAPGLVIAYTNHAVDGPPDDAVLTAFNIADTSAAGPVGIGPMLILLKLHTDMYGGLAGKLFLGGMGLLFLIAIVSGVVLYWPFTRRLEFGSLRRSASRRLLWLDWHNLIGITTLVWALVVGGTGVVNTWAELMLMRWQATELAAMVAPYAGMPRPSQLASLDQVVANASAAAPGMEIAFLAFPGTPFTSSHHFAAFMRGDQPLTSRLLKPVLLDGVTGEVTGTAELPFYLKALFVSQPLHFGDYAGLPLKIILAALDLFTIVAIGSGLYLWIARTRRRPQRAVITPGRRA